MGVIAMCRLVFSGCWNSTPEKLPRDGGVHAAGIVLDFCTVKIIADGNEAGVEQREHALNEVTGFNAVAPKAGKILDDDAVDLIGPHHLNELLHLRTLKVRTAVPIVNELRDFRVQGFRYGGCIFVEDKVLVFDKLK